MNHYPEEIDMLFKSCGKISFRAEISAGELEIAWGDGECLKLRGNGWQVVSHEFGTAGEFRIRMKGSRITSLNVARLNLAALSLHCPQLEYLDCSVNELGELDLSGCPGLEELYCNSNNIAALSFSAHPRLEQANVSCNRLGELDVDNCPALRALYASGNRLKRVGLNPENVLSYLDLSDNLLDANELNVVFRHFVPKDGQGIIHYMQNPGTDSCDTALLRTKIRLACI